MASTVGKDEDANIDFIFDYYNNLYKSDHPLNLENENHVPNMMKKFHTFQKQGHFCDVTINIGGRSFHAHKMVLAAASPYFEAMFLGVFVESSKSTVDIDGDGQAFEKLLEYAYTGALHLNEFTIVGALKLACYMQFEEIITQCKPKLHGYLNDGKILCEDALTLAMLASSYGKPVERLMGGAIRTMALKFGKFMKTETFVEDMCAEVFTQLLLEPMLALSAKEEEVLNGVIHWLSHDVSTRKQHAAKLVKTLRLGVIPATELEKAGDFFDKHNMVDCSEILRRVIKRPQARSSRSDDELHEMFTPRNIITAPLSVGGYRDNTIGYFSKVEKSWVAPPVEFATPPISSVPLLDPSITAIVVDGVLYVAGDSEMYKHDDSDSDDSDDLEYEDEDVLFLTKLWKYDPESNSWKELASMKSVLSEFALVHMDGWIYAVGMGYNGPTKTVVCYNISRNHWKYAAPLTCYYKHPQVVALNGKIFMYGLEMDYSGKIVHTYSLEMYDTVNNVWQKLISEKYRTPAYAKPVLTVQDGECYRVVHQYDETKMTEEEMEESEADGEIHVSEITIKERRNGQVTAVIGKKEKQVPLKYHLAFCLNGKVFVFLSDDHMSIYNTGIDVDSIGENGLDKKWKEMYVLGESETESIVTFTFDILKLQPKQ
ncbi:kelch repeat and BTB domain-containing protein 2-like [Amphiura filiformis]|uniref:kelch repeat and BTB domain-containing protein 2-like n=1 Tax=Amphiura filiformis TaxID=82378 RepID=UPI003B21B128